MTGAAVARTALKIRMTRLPFIRVRASLLLFVVPVSSLSVPDNQALARRAFWDKSPLQQRW